MKAQKNKRCRICNDKFAPFGNQRTCGATCGATFKRKRIEAFLLLNADYHASYRRAYYAANRTAILIKSRGRKKAPLDKKCRMCGEHFLATGRGKRVALVCSDSCRGKYERACRRSRQKDHPTRKRDTARTKRWRSENPDRAAKYNRVATIRATSDPMFRARRLKARAKYAASPHGRAKKTLGYTLDYQIDATLKRIAELGSMIEQRSQPRGTEK